MDDPTSFTTEVGIRLFAEQIGPILDRHCLACHSSSTKQGGLDLSTRRSMLAGGSRGPAVVSGDSRASLLYQLVTHSQEPTMPLEAEPLPAEAAALIALWIDLGAPFAEPHAEHTSSVIDMLAGRQGPPIYAETYRYIRGDEKNPDKSNPLSPAVPKILGDLGEPIQPIELPLESYYPSIQPFVHDDLLRQARQAITAAEAELVEAGQEEARAQKLAAMDPDEQVLKLGRERFDQEIKPIFDRNCVVCHGPNVARNAFRTITFDLLLEGGTRDGPGIVPGKSVSSAVIRRLRGDKQPRMPAEAPPLPGDVIEQIADWIDGLVPEDPQLVLRRARGSSGAGRKEADLEPRGPDGPAGPTSGRPCPLGRST